MADRYWVGSVAAAWDSTNTANWSTVSGGPGGASIPTSTDNVFFDANGTANCVPDTTATCANIDFTGYTGTVISTNPISVYGNLVAGTTYNQGINFKFYGNGSPCTVTANGKTFPTYGLGFYDGDYTIVGDLNSFNIRHYGGALNLGSGTKTLTSTIAGTMGIISSGTTTRSIDFGTGIINISGYNPITFSGSGLTTTANTATINCNYNSIGSSIFNGNNQNFPTVNYISSSLTTISINDSNTFTSLSFVNSTVATRNVQFGGNQTIGTLTSSGTTNTTRIKFASNSAGVQRTLSVTTIGSLPSTNWQDINLTGAASPWSPPYSVTDNGNNSGINFVPIAGPLYWVGGAGTWNTTSYTNWSLTSGGAGGTGAPSASTNVIIDTNSGTGTITISSAVCNDLTASSSSALTFSGSATIYGNFAVGGSGTFTALTPTFAATTTGKTIASGGKTLGTITLNGVGGEWTLLDALNTANNYVTLTNGSFVTGGQSVTGRGISSSNSNVRSINLGSSTLTFNNATPFVLGTTNLTFNAGTSTVISTSINTITFAGYGYTWHNVSLAGNNVTSISVTGANTFNNLTVTQTAVSSTAVITFDSTQTINGTLSTSGTTTTNRIQFGSSVAGTQRTLSVATIGTLTNTNWKDIALTGAASPWTAPLGVWDLGNNSGITFDTSTLYWVGGAGTWTDGTHWSTSSGGSAVNAAPGPNNNVVIDTSSGTGTISTSTSYCNNLTVTASQAIVLGGSGTTNLYIYGSLSFPSGGSFSLNSGVNNFRLNFVATTTGKTITTNGKGVNEIVFNGVGGEWTLGSDISAGSYTWTFTNGTLNTNNYNMSNAAAMVYTAGTAFTWNLGSSTITVNGTGIVWNFATTTGLTFNAGTSTISFGTSSTTQTTFSGGGLTYYNVNFNGVNTPVLINGANTFNNLYVVGPGSTGYKSLTLSADQTVNGTFTTAGVVGNRRINVISNTLGTQRTITAAAVSLTDTDFYGIVGAGTATWSGTRIGNATLNSGITFTTPKTVYWNFATGGGWMLTTAWATTSGGTPATTNFPLPQDTAIIEDTGLNASATINIGTAGVYLSSVDFSSRTLAMTFGWDATANVCGNITWDANVTSSGTSAVTFFGSTTLTSAGVTLTPPITVASGSTLTTGDVLTTSNTFTINGTMSLGDDVTTSSTITIGGTLTLNNKVFYALRATLNGTLNFGTGKLSLSGTTGGQVFQGSNGQIVTGTPNVELTAVTATSRQITPATPTEANVVNIKVVAGSGNFTIIGGGAVKSIDLTGSTCALGVGTITVYGDLIMPVGSTAGAIATLTFSGTSGTSVFDTNGITVDIPIAFNGTKTWQFLSNFTQGSTRATTLSNGTIDLNGKTYTCGSTFATGVGTKNLTFNGGTLVVPATTTTAFNNAQPANFTTTAGTGTGKISMTGATAKTFVGGGSTYNCTLEQAGAGALTITGSNTFNDITNTTQPVSVLFTAGTTNTFNNFSLSGTSGNLVTIGSVTAANHTLSKSSGIVDVSYCSISRSTATGGARWQAYTINGNVNGGNNSGWRFSAFSGNGLLFGSNF